MEFNDVILRLRGQDACDFTRTIRDGFETLWQEGADQGRVLCIAIHPYVSGQPHWIRAIDGLFQELRRHPQVWWTTGSEMSDWYYAKLFDDMLVSLRATA